MANPVLVCTCNMQILVSKCHFILTEIRAYWRNDIPDLVQEINKMIFEHLVVPETKEASKAMTHIQRVRIRI